MSAETKAILGVLRHAASASRGVITPGDVEALQAEQDLLGEALEALASVGPCEGCDGTGQLRDRPHVSCGGTGVAVTGKLSWGDVRAVLAKAGGK